MYEDKTAVSPSHLENYCMVEDICCIVGSYKKQNVKCFHGKYVWVLWVL